MDAVYDGERDGCVFTRRRVPGHAVGFGDARRGVRIEGGCDAPPIFSSPIDDRRAGPWSRQVASITPRAGRLKPQLQPREASPTNIGVDAGSVCARLQLQRLRHIVRCASPATPSLSRGRVGMRGCSPRRRATRGCSRGFTRPERGLRSATSHPGSTPLDAHRPRRHPCRADASACADAAREGGLPVVVAAGLPARSGASEAARAIRVRRPSVRIARDAILVARTRRHARMQPAKAGYPWS